MIVVVIVVVVVFVVVVVVVMVVVVVIIIDSKRTRPKSPRMAIEVSIKHMMKIHPTCLTSCCVYILNLILAASNILFTYG